MKIVIMGPPIPKARPRHIKRGRHTITYDPQSDKKLYVSNQFTQAIRRAFDSENKEIVIEASNLTYAQSYHLSIRFYLPIADSATEGQKNAKLWGFDACNKKPDCSNMLKFYEDAANQILFPDDCMIVSGDFEKSYDENPRTEINIMPNKELKINEKAEGILKVFGPNKLQEFFDDIKKFTHLYSLDVAQIDRDNREIWLTATASFLSDFAMNHSDALKKIRKYDGVVDEVGNIDQFLETSRFGINKTQC